MSEDRKIDVAIWQSNDETRVVEVAGLLATAGFGVQDLDLSTTRPMVILIMPGEGDANLASTCVAIADAYPNAPAIVFHTSSSEYVHPAVDHHVFELLPASMPLERLPDHIRAVLARWKRFEELKTSAATLQSLESTTDLIYFDFRPDTGTFCPSDQLRQIIGHYSGGDSMAPTPLLDSIHSEDRAVFAGTLFEAARSGTPFCVQIRLTDARGHQRHFQTRGRAFGTLDHGSSARVFAVCEDTTDHMQRLAEAEARSRIDDLTGLGNRRHFDDCLMSALARSKREREKLALLYVDLDRFKLINDTLGHDAGDQLLRVISARLSDAVRANDVVCLDHEAPGPEARVSRLGGDEFTVLLSGIHGSADAELVATRMLSAIGESVEIAGQSLTPSASVGISLFPDHGETTDDLRKRADAALYAAKGAGGGFRLFKQSMEDGAVRRLSLEAEIRTALERDEIELHYQPRIDFRTNETVGAEALIHWSSPTLGRVNEKEILRIAEDSGLISQLGRWALQTACKEAAFWASSREEVCRLSLNISPLQFEQDNVFDAVVSALKVSGLTPELLDIEITEGLLLRGSADTPQALEELRRMGVRIVLDEFGKGYSALAVLMSQPIDVLKLDQRLIETVAPDGEGSPLLRNVIRMANDLSLVPIAAGVAHQDQAVFLSEQGCHEMQGFFFSAAVSAETFRDKHGFS